MTMTFHKPLERAARLAAASALGAALLLAFVLAAPVASRAAASGAGGPKVRLTTLPVVHGLSVSQLPAAGAPAAARGAASSAGSPSSGASSVSAASVTVDAGTSFTMAGVVCDTPATAGAVILRLRASRDGSAWGPWYESELERNDSAGLGQTSFIEPVWTGSARYVQVGARAGTGRAPLALSGVRVVAIESTPGAGDSSAARTAAAAAASSTVSVSSAAATASSADAGAARSATPGPSQPAIVTRALWGADESLRTGKPSYAPVKMAFIHHTASGNGYARADGPAIVRAIYAYHTQSLKWSDIGYDFLIDRFGTIYEGRFGGVAEGVVGAQVLGFNTGSTGISIIGTFTTQAPPAAAMTSLENLLAWKLSLNGLDPQGTANMTCGATQKYKAGATVTFPVIAGHRDANFTECPGDALYALLPTVRTTVTGLMNPTKWVVALALSKASTLTGGSVTYSGSVLTATGDPGQGTVTLQRRPAAGGVWADWRTLQLAPNGTYSISVKMTSDNTWQVRARMPAAPGILAGYSITHGITVKAPDLPAWRITLSLSAASVQRGNTVTFSGTVKSASGKAGAGVITIQRRLVLGGPWSAWRTVTVGAAGKYSLSVRLTHGNTWNVRAEAPADAANAVGFSTEKGLIVF